MRVGCLNFERCKNLEDENLKDFLSISGRNFSNLQRLELDFSE